MRKIAVYAAVLAAMLMVSRAEALTPQEVLVVANSKELKSVELANLYLKARGIPQANLFLIETTTAYQVKRDDYDSQIRKPILDHLQKNKLEDKIRCICLMWGVPVRVAGLPENSDIGKILKMCSAATTRCKGRMGIYSALLATVGVKFPQPNASSSAPTNGPAVSLEALFGSPLPEPLKEIKNAADLRRDIDSLFKARQAEVDKLTDANQRAIANRQILALQTDAYGLGGLVDYLAKSPNKDEAALKGYRSELQESQGRLEQYKTAQLTSANYQKFLDDLERVGGAFAVYAEAEKRQKALASVDASVDSELSLLLCGDYPLPQWLPNGLHWKAGMLVAGGKLPVPIMTARLDGPSPDDVKRMISDSVEVEKTGLSGVFYIDTAGKYPYYNEHFRNLNKFLAANTKLKVVMNEKQTVFAEGTCPDAALYVGWYSLRKYVPAFKWVKGAVGWHVASFEAMNLRDPKSDEWCTKMIQSGVAATLGAVEEPYLQAFPLPEDFFPLLLTGKFTLAECYWRTTPGVSWMMTLIGDPLYNPFAAKPQVAVEALPKGLAPPQAPAESRPTGGMP